MLSILKKGEILPILLHINRKKLSFTAFAKKINKYSKKAQPVLLVRADGMKYEPVIIFKEIPG
jgi:hypothetical protein